MLPLERRKFIFGEQADHLLGLIVFLDELGELEKRPAGFLRIGKTRHAALEFRKIGGIRIADVCEVLPKLLGMPVRHLAPELLEPLFEGAPMVRLALGHHLEATTDAVGLADRQPRANQVATVGLGRAYRLQKRITAARSDS